MRAHVEFGQSAPTTHERPTRPTRGQRHKEPSMVNRARTRKITTHLWFNGNAEAAVEFYASVFPDLKVTNIARWGEGGPGPKGSVLNIAFEMAGQSFLALNGGPQYPFTPAISLFVTCESQADVDELWTKFLEGGGTPNACG